jgi:hypothetical protein
LIWHSIEESSKEGFVTSIEEIQRFVELDLRNLGYSRLWSIKVHLRDVSPDVANYVVDFSHPLSGEISLISRTPPTTQTVHEFLSSREFAIVEECPATDHRIIRLLGELRQKITSDQWPRFSVLVVGQILRDCAILSSEEFAWLARSGVPFFDGDPPWIQPSEE